MKTFAYILAIGLFLISTSCTGNFDDLNTDPNSATTVTPALLATPLLLKITETGGTASGFISDNCLAKQMVWLESLHDYNYNLLGRASIGDYKLLVNTLKMVELAEEKDKVAYEALALFIRSYQIFYFSMKLGDVPYSEALKGEEGLVKPKYDTQESVMVNLVNDLEQSASLFSTASNFEGDPILKGDVGKWKKVVDAFRLKILMYLSKKENHSELRVKERFAQIVSSGNLMDSNDDNFQLVFSNKAGQIYPFNRTVSKHYMYSTISSVVIDTLKAYDDYRLFYFAKPAATLIATGLMPNDPNAYIGLDPAEDFSTLQSQNADGACCTLNARYTDLITGEPYVRIGYAEQCFILAEAVLRGWITGNAADYYNKGIRAAMKFIADNTPDEETYHSGRPITDDYINQYIQKDIIKLNGNFENQLKQIITQKYLAYYMQYPLDAYYEYRRTGYPILPINSATNRNTDKNKIPVRWMYPIWEYDYNKEAVEEAVQRQYDGSDDYNKLMWILK